MDRSAKALPASPNHWEEESFPSEIERPRGNLSRNCYVNGKPGRLLQGMLVGRRLTSSSDGMECSIVNFSHAERPQIHFYLGIILVEYFAHWF